jgi:glycosyltransferase involved in cell wall biosynthesis
MRVLWITPLQLPSAAGESSMVGGGWIEGLRYALEQFEPNIELGIAAKGSAPKTPITHANATYFALGPAGRSRWPGVADVWHSSEGQDSTIGVTLDVIKQFRPDVIHVHGTEHALGIAAVRSDIPSVATIQGLATVCRHFMFDAVSFGDIVRSLPTRSFIHGHGLVPNYLAMQHRAAVEQGIISALKNFMGLTAWDRNVLGFLNPTARYFHTDCVVQSAYYEAQWEPPRSRTKTIFCTGGSAPYKGLETLLSAVELLRRAGGRMISLRVAGEVQGSAVWPALSHALARYGIGEQVVWLGPLPAHAIVRELQRTDVFVLPSHIENQPNALIEAMLIGVPSVAAAVGGVPELISNGVTGLLYHDRDAFALAGSLARLLNDESYATSLGQEARRVAHVRHDPETIAHGTRTIYDAVLADVAAKDPT